MFYNIVENFNVPILSQPIFIQVLLGISLGQKKYSTPKVEEFVELSVTRRDKWWTVLGTMNSFYTNTSSVPFCVVRKKNE